MKVEGSSLNSEFNEQLSRYAVRLAQPVFFGESPNAAYSSRLASGSGCFVRMDDKVFGVTCHHVVAEYRKRQGAVDSQFFQFGPVRFQPEDHILSESATLDLATFDLTSYVSALQNGIDPAKCIEPARWPPELVSGDDVLALAGFPGIWRDQLDCGYLRFYSFSSGATGVHSVGESHLVTRINIDDCLVAINDGLVLGSLGGLSGPVFAWRKTPVLFAELVGFVLEYQESFDLLYIRLASCLSRTGHLTN
jgi:hypothetical protein